MGPKQSNEGKEGLLRGVYPEKRRAQGDKRDGPACPEYRDGQWQITSASPKRGGRNDAGLRIQILATVMQAGQAHQDRGAAGEPRPSAGVSVR